MTKELEVIQRKMLQEKVSLGSSNAFSALQGSFDRLSGFGTGLASNIASQQAADAGGLDALSDEGSPKKVAPGLTKATREYNNAYNNVTTNLIGIEGQRLISQNLLNESQPGRLNSGSVGRFKDVTTGTIQGILSKTPQNLKADVALKLMASAENAGIRLAEKVSNYNNQMMEKQFASVLNEGNKQLHESIMAGDTEGAKIAKQTILDTLGDKEALGLLDEFDKQAILTKLDNNMVDSVYTSQYLRSRAEGTEESFLSNFSKDKPKDISFEQWMSSTSKILTLKRQQDALVSGQEALNLSELSGKIDRGEVNSLEQLADYEGTVSKLNYKKQENKLKEKIAEESALGAAVQSFNLMNAIDPAIAATADKKVQEAAYRDTLSSALELKKQETGDENAFLTLPEKAKAISGYNVPMKSFNDELSFNFESGPTERAQEYLDAYKLLAGNLETTEGSSKALSLSDDADKIAHAALLLRTAGGYDAAAALEKARNSVINADAPVRKARAEMFKNFNVSKNGTTKAQKQFKQAFGTSSLESPEAYSAFKQLYLENTVEFGSLDQALSYTTRQINGYYGKDDFAPDGNRLYPNPPSKAFQDYNVGYLYENQFKFAVKGVSDQFQEAEALAPKIPEMSKRYKEILVEASAITGLSPEDDAARVALQAEAKDLVSKINAAEFSKYNKVRWGGEYWGYDKVSQKDMVEKQLLAVKPTLEIWDPSSKRWFKREIFELPDMDSTTRENGKYTTSLVYKDDFGNIQYVPSPFNEMGRAEFAPKTVAEIAPDYSEVLEEVRLAKISRDAVEKMTKNLQISNAQSIKIFGDSPGIPGAFDSESREQEKLSRAQKERLTADVKKRLKEKKNAK